VSHIRVSSARRRLPCSLGVTAGLAMAVLLTGSPVALAQEAAASASPASSAGIDGSWIVDTEIGDFADYSSSWVGFRVAEELQGIGDTFAVGRTPDVRGSLTAAGSIISDASLEVDLTTIASDQARRDPAIQRALDTTTFPTATLVSREPVDLGSVPVEGEPFTASFPATLTIRGVSQDVDATLTGQREGDVVVVVGTLPIDFTSFDLTMPTAPVVLSVEDSGDLEWQLFFRLDSAAAAEAGADSEVSPAP
jgi:polyisoprenoid-binding protein YceI